MLAINNAQHYIKIKVFGDFQEPGKRCALLTQPLHKQAGLAHNGLNNVFGVFHSIAIIRIVHVEFN